VNKRKSLGRGLDALLSSASGAGVRRPETAAGEPATSPASALREVPVDLLERGRYQPRVDMRDETLAELAESIKAQGLVQPILVRPIDGGRFEIIAGERRWRASQRAGLRELPALVRDVADQAALALSLIENIQREDLNPLEQAQGIARLIGEFGLTHEAAAQAVGRSRSAVTNLLRLMQLARPVQELLLGGKLDMGHARALLSLPAARQAAAAGRIVAQGMSVRETERMVHGLQAPAARRTKRDAGARADSDLARLEGDLVGSVGERLPDWC